MRPQLPQTSNTPLSLIIPTYNGRSLLQATLAKNLAWFADVPGFECIVVDDASQDETVAWLRAHFPEVTVLVSPQNRGFAHAVSLGAAHAMGDVLFFLNNDMEIISLDLRLAYAHVQQDKVFAIVPTIVRPSKNNAFESYTWGKFQGGWFSAESYVPKGGEGAIVPSDTVTENRDPISRVVRDGVPVLWACGGALMVTRQKYEAVGGFDTLFSPFYFEDLDLCYRGWKRGWESRYVDFAVVHHQHQATIGSLFTPKQVGHIHRTHHYLFMWKNIDDLGYVLSHGVTVLIKLLTFQVRDIRAMGVAVLRLPQILRYRLRRVRHVSQDREILSRW